MSYLLVVHSTVGAVTYEFADEVTREAVLNTWADYALPNGDVFFIQGEPWNPNHIARMTRESLPDQRP